MYFTSSAYRVYIDYINVVDRGLCKPCTNSISSFCSLKNSNKISLLFGNDAIQTATKYNELQNVYHSNNMYLVN